MRLPVGEAIIPLCAVGDLSTRREVAVLRLTHGNSEMAYAIASADESRTIAVRALALGAADTLTKASTSTLSTRFGSALVSKLEMLCAYQRPMP
jgi:hypothetical protein